jgi:hypothetical protein
MILGTRAGSVPAATIRRVAVRPLALREANSRLAVGGLTDHRHVRLGLEDHPEAGADEGLVVGDQDPKRRRRHGWTGPVGNQARTA